MPRRILPVLTIAITIAALAVPLGGSPATAYPAATVDLVGHGFGHGRGMGQYGALGGALAGVPYTTILDHFYGGTRMGAVPDAPVGVRILRLDGQDTIAVQERGAAITSAAPDRQFTALRTRRTGPNTFEISSGPGCLGPWTVVVPSAAGPVTLASALPAGDDRTAMLQLCDPAGTRWYRGDLSVLDSGGARTVNHVPLEAYLRGVVPRESPSSWGTLGGGRGMHALRAQAVVARSYAVASNNYPYAKTCDTTACQVYGGVAVQDAAGFRELEAATTDAAVAETAGQVRVFLATGAVALTEFSSSTGGYSAGGLFPAVVDDGDATPHNPNHNWSAKVPVADIQAAYPAIGTLQSVDVVRRNGLGDLGGRVLELVLRGDRGSQTLTGAEFRRFTGVRSDWFAVTNNAQGGIAGYWMLTPDGGVAPFGAARPHGSMAGRRLARPIVGMAATPAGNGYWLVASDGGIFAFGDAAFRGSTGAIRLNQPIVGMAATPSGNGYWLVASDGGIFSFGDAGFRGSLPGIGASGPARAIQPVATGQGYLIVTDAGRVHSFGDAPFLGDLASSVRDYAGGVRGLATVPTR